MLHDILDAAVALHDLVSLYPGVVESMDAFYMLDLVLKFPIEVKVLVVDQVVDGCVIADLLSVEKSFYIPYSAHGQGIACDKIPRRRLAELPGPQLYDLFQLGNALILTGVDGDDGDTQLALQPFHVDVNAFGGGKVHHRERYHHRYFQIDDLAAEEKVSFQVGGVHQQNHHIGMDTRVLA